MKMCARRILHIPTPQNNRTRVFCQTYTQRSKSSDPRRLDEHFHNPRQTDRKARWTTHRQTKKARFTQPTDRPKGARDTAHRLTKRRAWHNPQTDQKASVTQPTDWPKDARDTTHRQTKRHAWHNLPIDKMRVWVLTHRSKRAAWHNSQTDQKARMTNVFLSVCWRWANCRVTAASSGMIQLKKFPLYVLV